MFGVLQNCNTNKPSGVGKHCVVYSRGTRVRHRTSARVCINKLILVEPINNIVTDLVVGNAYLRKYKVSIFEVPWSLFFG